MAASSPLADALHALLPQTQCTRCGYDGCRPYAEAIAASAADINRCPPGGETTLQRLAALTGRPLRPIDPECGTAGPPMVAVIDAARCIGCARCLPPCPVDAIVGAQRQLHVVLDDLCTGCELCIAPCPVDCITLAPRATQAPRSPEPAAVDNLRRHDAHGARRERREAERLAVLAERKARAARLSPRGDGGAP
ncbi:MAG: RnfABCDGE type electron transport complex subunit B [Gammaproteobacteria bacterium]